MTTAIDTLAGWAGTYIGLGDNHEGEAFTGRLVVTPVVGGLAVRLAFRATGDDGTVFHEEETLVTGSQAGPVLFTVSSNLGGGLLHESRSPAEPVSGATTLVFGAGDRDDPGSFREEIAIDLHDDGSMGYRFAWGLPGGDFADRSAVRMRPDTA